MRTPDIFDAPDPELCAECRRDCLTLEPEQYAQVKVSCYGQRYCPDCIAEFQAEDAEPKPPMKTELGKVLFGAFGRTA